MKYGGNKTGGRGGTPAVLHGKNLVLTGFMGTGKSAVGKVLARCLGRRLVDTDLLVERETGLTIDRLFELEGESGFRDRESAIIAACTRDRPGDLVIATGGGAVLREENRRNLQRDGLIVLLTASPRAILRRIRKQGGRPLLKQAKSLQEIVRLLAEREPCYSCHHIKVDTTGKKPSLVAREILGVLAVGEMK